MRVSVCITTLNEERSIGELLTSLLEQTKKPDEIFIVDAGSRDQTVEVIKHYKKHDQRINFIVEKCSRSKGRNLSVELSRNDIIAMTDAGCIAKKDWLEHLISPFGIPQVDIVAGFYDMTGKDALQKAFSVFLGVTPTDFDNRFLPSTRSVAFRKSAWERVGGFPERIGGTAEDTVFNYNALKAELKIARAKSARVEWAMPTKFKEGINKIYEYAKGDAKSKIWRHPVKGLMSHNVKVFLKITRYVFALGLLIAGFKYPILILVLFGLIFLYTLWAFYKVLVKTGDLRSGFWGPAIQYASDYAAIKGFFDGYLKNFPLHPSK